MQIILDLGASFLKGYVVEGQLDNIVETFETPGLAKKQINLSDASFLDPFCLSVQRAVSRYPIESAVIAEEMHGFSSVGRRPRDSFFYSWRSRWDYVPMCRSFFESALEFEMLTGLRVRNGYGVWGLLDGAVGKKSVFGSASSLLLQLLGQWNQTSDLSMLHSQGVISIDTRCFLDSIYPKFEYQLPTINRDPHLNPIGELSLGARCIPVYGGIGDLIATLDGIFQTDVDSRLVVNSGTGSQIAIADVGQESPVALCKKMEHRLGNLRDYYVISHIPCGRAIEFFRRICVGLFPDKSESEFWEEFAKSEPRTVSELTDAFNVPSFSLGVFDSATLGVPGGLAAIVDSVRFEEYISGLKNSLVSQYSALIKTVIPQPNKLTFSGGIFQRNPDLASRILREIDAETSGSFSDTSSPIFGLIGYG